MLVRAPTTASGRLAVAARGSLARRVDLRVSAIAERVLVGLHRRIGEVLPAVLRDDATARRERERDDQPDRPKLHPADTTLRRTPRSTGLAVDVCEPHTSRRDVDGP